MISANNIHTTLLELLRSHWGGYGNHSIKVILFTLHLFVAVQDSDQMKSKYCYNVP